MILRLPLASGDPVLFAMVAGVLLVIGAAFGLGVAGGILVLSGKGERRSLGKRLLLAALVPIVVGAAWWVAVVGLD